MVLYIILSHQALYPVPLAQYQTILSFLYYPVLSGLYAELPRMQSPPSYQPRVIYTFGAEWDHYISQLILLTPKILLHQEFQDNILSSKWYQISLCSYNLSAIRSFSNHDSFMACSHCPSCGRCSTNIANHLKQIMIEHQVLVHWQVMTHITTHGVLCMDSSHIELPIIKHDGNDIVIAMGSCDVFRKLRNTFFIVIICGTQIIAHLVSLRAHLRMRSITFWQSYIAATLS